MKTSSLWKSLTRDQRRAWNAWAKNNPALLDDGTVRRVSGRKAMTLVVRNRIKAGEAANPTAIPAAPNWMAGQVFSLRDAGPYTVNGGYLGFRCEQPVPAGTKWFVWATWPVNEGNLNASGLHSLLRFVKVLAPGAMGFDDMVPTMGPEYVAVNGSWVGPGYDGAWFSDKYVWFRVHQYVDGQLGPGLTMRGQIQVEL
jgi:hypothetical protein